MFSTHSLGGGNVHTKVSSNFSEMSFASSSLSSFLTNVRASLVSLQEFSRQNAHFEGDAPGKNNLV